VSFGRRNRQGSEKFFQPAPPALLEKRRTGSFRQSRGDPVRSTRSAVIPSGGRGLLPRGMGEVVIGLSDRARGSRRAAQSRPRDIVHGDGGGAIQSTDGDGLHAATTLYSATTRPSRRGEVAARNARRDRRLKELYGPNRRVGSDSSTRDTTFPRICARFQRRAICSSARITSPLEEGPPRDGLLPNSIQRRSPTPGLVQQFEQQPAKHRSHRPKDPPRHARGPRSRSTLVEHGDRSRQTGRPKAPAVPWDDGT